MATRGIFRPTQSCTVQKHAGTDKYGETIPGAVLQMRCDVVRIRWESAKTLMSREHSATAGAARENLATSLILMEPDSGIAIGDTVTVTKFGFSLVVTSIHPRYDVGGRLHHIEVEGMPA